MSGRESLSLSRLRQFQPLAILSDDQLVLLINKAERRLYGPGQKVADRGARDGRDLYLLYGAVELTSADGRKSVVTANTDRAITAIARLQPRMFDVTAVKPCEFLVLDQAALNQFLRAAPVQGQELAEAGIAEEGQGEEHGLLMAFYAELRSNQVSLPSVPDVAWKVRRLADREETTAGELARAISADPSMSAKVVRACNSALYRGFSDVRNLRDAVVRLGTRTTRQLVTVFAMREVFRSRRPELQQAMDELWESARTVAALSYVLAEAVSGIDPEEALLAGLLHNLGSIPVLVHAEQHPALFADKAQLQAAMAELQGDVGAAVLENWGFPRVFVEVARHAHDWRYECPKERPQLVDLVIVSRLHAMISANLSAQVPEFEAVPAYRRLGELELTASRSLELLSNARGRLEELKRLLSMH